MVKLEVELGSYFRHPTSESGAFPSTPFLLCMFVQA